MRCLWTEGHVSTYHFVYVFFLYIGFVSIVNTLTEHWCTQWDHATCLCMSTPKTDWHVPMCTGVEKGYLP